MKNVLLIFALISLFPALVLSDTMTPYDLVYLTEHYPPHNFMENGKLKGISVEILEEIWKELKVELTWKDVRLVPWARGYKRVLNEDNIMLFGMGYSEERARNLQWIGPYHKHTCVLIARKDRNININTLEDAKSFKIGVVRDDIGEQILKGKGFNSRKFDKSSTMDSMLKKLHTGRLDLVSYMDDIFYNNLDRTGFKSDDFEIVYQIIELKSGYGFSNKVPSELVARFQMALDKFLEKGVVQKIKDKYSK